MIQTDDEIKIYHLYKKLNLDPAALPNPAGDDPMDAAERADALGDLAFLSEPLEPRADVPHGLLTRALALGPRPSPSIHLRRWRQAWAALLTFVIFGSGSYALASGLARNLSDLAADTNSFNLNDAGLFEAASDNGFFIYD